jgi:D-alanine--poly(phosphoribitol) ligase subunit 2
MDQETIASKLESFIREKYDVADDDSDFDRDVHLFDYGYVDSFGAVELIDFVEGNFDVKISESDLVVHPLNTIHEISGFVAARRQGQV